MTNETNELIFGKDTTNRIVSVENKDNEFHIFKQKEDGNIITDVIPSNFWFITNRHISSKQTVLDGDQHYRFFGNFNSQEQRDEVYRKLKKNNIDTYRIYDQKEQSLIYNGMTYYKGLEPKQISILSFDIETTTLTHTDLSKILIISNTYRNHLGHITKKLFSLDDYNGNEKRMIQDWIRWVMLINPSILLGHNIFAFDIPYIYFRCKTLGIYLKLGRDGSTLKFDKWTSSKRKDGSQDIEYTNCHVFGREVIDTMFLSITYDVARNFPSYGLKPIINYLGKQKPDRTFVDAAKIGKYYEDHLKGNSTNWLLSKLYAGEDSDDSLTLFDIMIPAYFYFTRSVSKSFQQMVNSATGSQINNIMVRSYLQMGHSIAKADNANPFEGAISFGIAGIYENGFKVDVAALYPSIMRHYQIYHPKKDPYQHFLKILEYFTLERLKNKKLAKETGNQYYKDLEQSEKVAINSAYGFMGAVGLNYNYPFGAAETTRHGREVLMKATMFATGKDINYWKGLSNVE